MRATSAQSLRSQVEKWLTPHLARSIRVTVFGRTGPLNRRYVRVEVQEAEDSHALFFFLQDGGCWSVLPARKTRSQKMRAERFVT
jgi:hypothetical protein